MGRQSGDDAVTKSLETPEDIIQRLRAQNEHLRQLNDGLRAENERLMIYSERYWEGRWRDEKVENERLREALECFAQEPLKR